MEARESQVECCKTTQDDAKTGEEAMAYYELAQLWMERERNSNG